MDLVTTLDKQEEVLNNPNKLKEELRNSPEVRQLVQSIDIKDQVSLIEFGKESSLKISGFADRILATTKSSSMEESSALIKNLTKVMDKFDPKDFTEDKGLLSRVFNRGKNMMDKVLEKYQTMGSEIDKIYIEIKKYETEMKSSTKILEELYHENYNYFFALEKYIAAAELKAEELKLHALPSLEERARNGDQMAMIEMESMRNAIDLLEQRAFDLEMAKQVAFQTAPQIRMLQRGNTKLIGKINSAFVVTIPVFKNGLIQAIAAKRQKLVADSMAELDARTNEMMLKNAQNISSQSQQIARMAGAPSIKLETMEETWKVIMTGLKETKAIEDENARNRETSRTRIQELKKQYEQA
ncbi:MAG: toxic anion resistance protein [Defluviitaleaceae bacterium]|nr:toxic anion resistance protein [Defluviitaleaceae bacterium]